MQQSDALMVPQLWNEGLSARDEETSRKERSVSVFSRVMLVSELICSQTLRTPMAAMLLMVEMGYSLCGWP